MSSEWKTYRLQEVGRIVTGKTPKSGITEYEGNDVPFVSPPDFSGAKWITETVRAISEIGAQSVKGSLIPSRSVLVTCIGSDMGKAAIVASNCVANQQINALIVDESKFCPEFLYYNLSQRKNEIRGLAGGSAQPILNKTAFGQISFDAPALKEQKDISAALRPLDDRITLLRETNATLEAIAQALFKSWFVDFDPVRAKMEGRAPEGMDEATAALFPDSFEETELGTVPLGWQWFTVGEMADVVDCLHSKKPELLATGRPFLQLNNIRDDGLLDISALAGISESDYTKWTSRIEVDGGDCVITNVGRVGAVAQIPEGFAAAMGRNMTAIRLREEWLYPTYLIELLQSPWMKAEIDTKTDVGTILNALNVKSIPRLRCCVAPHQVMRRFEEIARPLRATMEGNLREAQTLASLRDALLPRLISGQLRLPEAVEAFESI